MIKFFRNIRHRLIGENRFSKYLVYAVGEIILVVIGILIALQINTWNEERKLRNLEISYYENLLSDLKKDSVEFHFKKSNAIRNQAKLLNILRYIDSGYNIEKAKVEDVEWRRIIFRDTAALMISLSQAGFVQFPKLFENTISDLRNTGNIKLISNTELKNEITLYYNKEKLFEDWNESYLPTRTQIDMVINRIMPWEVRTGYNREKNLDFERIMNRRDFFPEVQNQINNEPELKGLVVGMIHIQSRIRDQAFLRSDEVADLMRMVAEEIKTLEDRRKFKIL